MGLWEWIRKAAMAVKRFKPSVKPVITIYNKGLDVSRAAKVQVNSAVAMTAREIHGLISDDHVRDHLRCLLKQVSKNGVLFVVCTYDKTIQGNEVFVRHGGGPLIDIFSQSIQDRKADSQMERLEELELKVAQLQWELYSRDTVRKYLGFYSFKANMNQKQEEKLREYLMKHLVVKFLDDPNIQLFVE